MALHPDGSINLLRMLQKNSQVIETFVSAWTSGSLDAVDGKSSMASEIAVHHVAALFFEEGSATDKAFLRKIAKRLFDTPTQVFPHTVISCYT